MLRADQRLKIEEALQQCGPHDFGLDWTGCQCYMGDPRPLLAAAVDEVDRLMEENARLMHLLAEADLRPDE